MKFSLNASLYNIVRYGVVNRIKSKWKCTSKWNSTQDENVKSTVKSACCERWDLCISKSQKRQIIFKHIDRSICWNFYVEKISTYTILHWLKFNWTHSKSEVWIEPNQPHTNTPEEKNSLPNLIHHTNTVWKSLVNSMCSAWNSI